MEIENQEEILTMDRSSSATLEFPIQSIAVRPRMSDILFSLAEKDFANFGVVPSNIRAVESAIRFSAGINPFVAIIGPSGWGKSHLLSAAADQMCRDGSCGFVQVISAQDWVASNRVRTMSGPLILDNAQELIQKSRSRNQFQIMLERRLKGAKPTLLSFTDVKVTRAIRQALPNSRDWVVATIKAAPVEERQKIVLQLGKRENVDLSATLAKILSSRLEGNGRTILGAIKRLRLAPTDGSSSESVLQACGILNPFFSSNSGWDLREHIAEKAKQLQPSDWGNVVPFDLAIYVMLKVALLGEADVAKFFRIEQRKAYAFATRFSEKVQTEPLIRQIADDFVQSIVADL
jgi:energy-coupling factor transporter ATP-binding protein EcfA2